MQRLRAVRLRGRVQAASRGVEPTAVRARASCDRDGGPAALRYAARATATATGVGTAVRHLSYSRERGALRGSAGLTDSEKDFPLACRRLVDMLMPGLYTLYPRTD